jgi:hypothetical protein
MANWTDMGHAMRRRMGAPSNHHESVGKRMKNNLTPEQIVATGARAYMGSAANAFSAPGAASSAGKLMPKKNTQAGDPTIMNKANRQNVEYKGAQHRITAKMPAPINSEASATMANARVIPSVMGRQAPNFNSGVDSTY